MPDCVMDRLNAIPTILLEHSQWVAWRLEARNGKPTKIPIDPYTGQYAAVDRPETWGTFEDARARAKADDLAGVGFVFTADDPYTGIDLDKCFDPEASTLEPWAQNVVKALNSYTELSPSRWGLHIIIKGKLPEGGHRKGRIEMYDQRRFFCMTGLQLPETPLTIADRQAELEHLHTEIFQPTDQSTTNGQPWLSDTDLIRRASSAKNGAKFSRLWSGEWHAEGYPSQSEADAALCSLLAFWTGGDTARIDSLFRQSGLFRQKWDERHHANGHTYGQETISRSCVQTTERYGNGRQTVGSLKAGAAANPSRDGGDDRHTISVQIQDLPTITKLAWDAIKKTNCPPRLFRFGGLPSRLEHTADGSTTLRELTTDRLRHEVARAARWVKGEKDIEKDAKPPLDVIKDMLACPEIPLPSLVRVVEAPVFGRSGKLLDTPGYHADDCIYYAASAPLDLPRVPIAPTREQVDDARRVLVEDLLGDFPFVSDAGRAHALAALLLPFVRDLIDGPTPLHLIEKPTPRTGATLLASMLVLPAVGRNVTHITEAQDTDEWRKVLTALLLGSPVAICLDNLRRRLDAASLASALTATLWTDRLLGHSEKVTVPVRCLWLATGNNPNLSDELVGRSISIRLDAQLDRPQDRTGFRHHLPEWGLSNRAVLIHAALVLCQAWIAAGQPVGLISRGGFEEWSRVLGGVLAHTGVAGFLTERETDLVDPETHAWSTFVHLWWGRYQYHEVGVSELFELVNPFTERDPIDLGLPDGSPRSQKTSLGKRLVERRDRQFTLDSGIRVQLKAAKLLKRAQLWQLRQVQVDRTGWGMNLGEPVSHEEHANAMSETVNL